MPNEFPTHEEMQAYIRRAHQARSVALATLIARGIDAAGPLIKKPLAIAGTAVAVLIGGVLVQADTGTSSTAPRGFAAACAEREAALITTAESDGIDATAALAQSGLELMTARSQCHDGKIKEAVALYDDLIRQVAGLGRSHGADAAE
jgi:hypothetical protein